ncbi:MAG: hypothetical protein WA110_02775, partial [Anaerolineaceae bacterium]
MNFTNVPNRVRNRFKVRKAHSENDRQIRHMAETIVTGCPKPTRTPLLFFNVSTRLTGLSLNAGFSLVTSWSLRLQGIPVVHFMCERGMTQCV